MQDTVVATGRRHATTALFLGVVFVNTAMVGASAVGTLIAADAMGVTWSGSINAAGVLGTALGALGLASSMARWRPSRGDLPIASAECG